MNDPRVFDFNLNMRTFKKSYKLLTKILGKSKKLPPQYAPAKQYVLYQIYSHYPLARKIDSGELFKHHNIIRPKK